MASYPFTITEPIKWKDVLERHRIKESTWKKMMLEYQNWCPEFNPNILDYVDDEKFCNQCNAFYYFKKKTIKNVKKEFLKWLKEYWQVMHADTFEEICIRCNSTLYQYNEENKEHQLPFINWIPFYGGLLRKGKRDERDEEFRYHIKHKIGFPYEPQVPPTGED
jgi:aromatic ring-opening dioxygenase catalytic subunit (LigB family)